IEPWTPMHPASVSGLVHAIRALLDGPAPRPAPAVVDAPASPPRRISPEEEAEIHARADEVLARVTDALAEFGSPRRYGIRLGGHHRRARREPGRGLRRRRLRRGLRRADGRVR